MSEIPTYRIAGWDDKFENSRTRQMGLMRWVPVPNSFDGDRISELISEGQAPAYAAWVACVLVSSKCNPRGTLVRNTGRPHDSTSLSRMTGLSAKSFSIMFPIAETVGLLEVINPDTTKDCQVPVRRVTDSCQAPDRQVTESCQEGDTEGRKEGIEGKEGKRTVWLGFAPVSLIQSFEFVEAWAVWERHRGEIKKKLTETSVLQQFKQLEEIGPDRAVAMILHTVGKGWTGLREPDTPNNTPTETITEIAVRIAKQGIGDTA